MTWPGISIKSQSNATIMMEKEPLENYVFTA
jgi:hypothetical protein